MSRIAIIAALAGELKPRVRGWQGESRHGVNLWRRRRGENEWIAAAAGIGVDAAARAFEEIEKTGTIDAAVSTGWAGALDEQFAAGRAYRVSGVVDARSGGRFRAAGPAGECWLVTSDRVADQAEKRRLAAAHGAGLVDMEAAGVARLAAARGIPFYCVKGVSDGVSDRLPDFNRFIAANGQFQQARFIFSVIFRPWYWPALMRMGGNTQKAAKEIKKILPDLPEHSPR